MFRTVSGQKVGDDMKVSSEQTSAVTSVQKILLAVSRLAERSSNAVHQDGRMHRE